MRDDFNEDLLNLPFNIHRTSVAIRGEITRRLSEAFGDDFTVDYWYILTLLFSREPLSQAHLAQISGRDKGSLSRTLACMERLDLVVRLPNPDNSRSELVSSTKAASNFKPKAESIILDVLSEALSSLRPIEVIELNRMLAAINEKIQP
ncbi:MAG: winged helix-turn-helix transcriptional regulator [Bacteroidales bacterium]|nr:winged helix-turn-helix transcriptional regulator [Bacteroidales bacterium]HNT41693.1 MarR family winged helix-turn-helix transcriptional regulator [Tenuifilaceae bacterium]HOA09306.1 MarR family winged helix-turn-helix transcriptional regulator [Tenuifilaceae bacterium]HOY71584.1 MarR family winged helix-turn-helix transcriptional regulator [Tenuifilaceae bacterium]HPA66892.1 MarR family winged helix-turn-helix transcriptional regulator [Tenuifilaceae bacterium]